MAMQVKEASSDDVAAAIELMKEVPEHASSVLSVVQGLLGRVKENDFTSDKGISFFDVKNQSLLSYIINLTHIIMRKMSGKKIENDPAIKRLTELRVVLEKMKPINERLKYQVDKLLASLTSGNVDTNDPLRFKANPDNFISTDNMETDSSVKEKEKKASNVYVPPKISATYYDGEDTVEVRKKSLLDRAHKRALSSSMLQELRKEYDTGPEEYKETVDPHRQKISQEIQERTVYEEQYMLRLPLTKKQMHDARQLTTVTNFSTKFDDISALELGVNDVPMKKKLTGKKHNQRKDKGKKKGFKRKRH